MVSEPLPPERSSASAPPAIVSLLSVPTAVTFTCEELPSKFSPDALARVVISIPSSKATSVFAPRVTACWPVPLRARTSPPTTLSKSSFTKTTSAAALSIRKVSSPKPASIVASWFSSAAEANTSTSSPLPESILSAPTPATIESLPSPAVILSSPSPAIIVSAPSPPPASISSLPAPVVS